MSDWEIEAVRAIQRFAADGDAIIGTSWGKDSVVVTHLAHQAGVTLPVVRMVRDRVDRIENPDVPAVRDTYLATYPVNYAEFLSAADDGLAEMNRAYFGRYISGVRAAESAQRVVAMKTHGVATASTCRPIGWWPTWAVWAYLAKYDLPIHPAYACTGGGALDRDRIRVHCFGDTERGSGVGRLEWERRYYREVWDELDRATA